VARHLPRVLGCFLIGSVRSPRELPFRLRMMRPATRLAHRVPFEWLPRAARAMTRLVRPFCAPATMAFLRQVSDADAAFLRWACRAVMTWEPAPQPFPFPIHQIHGMRDPILPWRLTSPDVLVRGAGHVLSLTHPREVNEFIRSRLHTAVSV
jgi:pimeloyl-ACP methyl ester carboxylesterase